MLEQVNFVYPIEPGIYKIAGLPEKKNNQPSNPTSFTDSLGYGFVYIGSEYKEPAKLYGNVIERSTYIWNNFVRNEASSGVLLTGQKGGGKTVLAKHLANIAISKGLKVFVVAEIKIDRKLISFISGLNNCVIFIDEFYKVVGWQYQDDFLSLMSDKNKKRLFILTENDLSNINRFILDRPERIRYHYEYSTLDPNVIKEFCKDYNVPEDFKNKLLKLNMSNRNFSFDHLHALVTEAISSGRWDIEWLIEIMNVKSLKMKEIKRPVKVCAIDNPDIYIELEPSPIDQNLGVVKLGNSMLQANYLTWKKLRNNETIPEPLLANYNLTKEKIEKFEDKMLLLEKIEKQAGNIDVEGLLPGNRRRNYDFDTNQQPVTENPINIIKVNFSPEFMLGMDDNYSIYADVTGDFKVYIESKKLIY